MNGIQNRKAQNIERFPGCLGRMVNMFDWSTGVPGNRLLTDKPHRDGSSLSRSQSDVVRMLSPSFEDQIEDKEIVSELRRTSSNKKTNGTPMKTLIAQEMSKEVESLHNSPNVVAKLMGLETLPKQQPNLAAHRSYSKGSSRHSMNHPGISAECWEQDEGFLEKRMQCDSHHCQERNKCKDVYEIWQQSQKTTYTRNSSPNKGRYNENVNEKKMALVRQKFMEAKHLVTDEKLRQTQEFQDALDVLSSNRDLLLKCLEPNSMLSQHLYDLQNLPPPPETKRITVLRPSKVVENDKFKGMGKKGDNQTNKSVLAGQVTEWDKNTPGYSPPFANQNAEGYPTQATRIVVLKPSPGKAQDIKTVVSPSPSSPRILHGDDFFEDPEDDDAQESREVAKEITRKMRENLMGHHRDETLLSSVFSNGYIGDDSSFNKSENEYAVGNLSDSEVMSPASRLSWDYINKFGSPFSSSSFSRASCSPESSVCREAKKRLSERWALMASNGSFQEQRHVRRSSSTLGEMLALSDAKKPVKSDEGSGNKEQEARGSTSYVASNVNEEERMGHSPKNLVRSKSVPVSSTAYGARLNVEVSDPEACKTQVPKELSKTKSMKSSLKGKVSSLFFSKNKKVNKEKSGGPQSKDDSLSSTPGAPGSPLAHPRKSSNDASQCMNDNANEEFFCPALRGSANKTSFPDLISMGQKKGIIQEAGLSVANPLMPGHVNENQDQPSPISVLDPPFEEDEKVVPQSSSNFKLEHNGTEVFPKSNLIDKSPPIESIARTLSWDYSCAEPATSYPSKPSLGSPGTKEEEQDWFFFVQSLLSAAGLDHEVQSDSYIVRWHSPDSPLDPSLREKYANFNEKKPVQEAKRRQWRSNRKLVFDCVNAALVEITGNGSYSSMRTMSFGRARRTFMEGASPRLVDNVWAQMKEWFSSEVKCYLGDDGDSNSLVVERVVRKEVVGSGWVDNMKLEIDNMGKEIEGKLLQELVEEAVVDLTGRVL